MACCILLAACLQSNPSYHQEEVKKEQAVSLSPAGNDSNTSAQNHQDAGPASANGKSMGRPGAHVPGVPDKAYQTAAYVDKNHSAPSGYVGGRVFENREHRLPERDAAGNLIEYNEYDVNPHQEGVNRGAERIIISSKGQHYYTNDHYRHFTSF
jgi:ribonuclease T1